MNEIVCESCDYETDSKTAFCPICGEEDAWVEEPAYEFDEDDLPITFSTYAYDDHYGLWDAFCEEYFGVRVTGSNVSGLPDDFPRMKFYEEELFWTIDEDYEIHGPFLRAVDARDAAR